MILGLNWWWFAAITLLPITGAILLPGLVGGAWSPTPKRVVNRSMHLAELKPGETLYDLGAGDGRIVVRAAKGHGAFAVGVEVDPLKVAIIFSRIRLKGLQSQVRIRRSNFFDVDLRGADVVFAYLSPAAIERLREKFERELPSGARVVSYRRPISGWKPWKTEDGIYVYLLPSALGLDEALVVSSAR